MAHYQEQLPESAQYWDDVRGPGGRGSPKGCLRAPCGRRRSRSRPYRWFMTRRQVKDHAHNCDSCRVVLKRRGLTIEQYVE